jgi:replicative DNA helicase
MQEPYADRSMPHSEDAERTILGAVLIDNGLIGEAITTLKPEFFYNPLYRRIFTAMVALFDKSRNIDAILIGEEMKKESPIDSFGGIATITNLTLGLPRLGTLDDYVKLVKDNASIRSLIRECGLLTQTAMSGEMEATQLLDHAESAIYGLRSDEAHDKATLMADEVTKSIVEARKRYDAGSSIIGLPTGFRGLDEKLQGFRGGQQVLIAARPSIGKTAIATRILYHVGTRLRVPTLMFSLEMSKEEIADRIICAECNLDSRLFRSGYLNDQQWVETTNVAEGLQGAPVYINDDPYITLRKMRTEVRRINTELRKKGQRLGLVITDHVGLVEPENKRWNSNRENEVASVSRGQKKLAKEFDLVSMSLSQLNRQSETRADHRPTMADLRESGALEQDADIVALLYREDVYQKDASLYTNIAEVIVAKNRNGPTGPIKLHFERKSARFSDLAEAQSFEPSELKGDVIL